MKLYDPDDFYQLGKMKINWKLKMLNHMVWIHKEEYWMYILYMASVMVISDPQEKNVEGD